MCFSLSLSNSGGVDASLVDVCKCVRISLRWLARGGALTCVFLAVQFSYSVVCKRLIEYVMF